MKKLMSLLLSIIMILAGPAMTSYAKPDWPADTGIQSEAGIVMDMDSKTVIFGQNIHVQKAPASIPSRGLLNAVRIPVNSGTSARGFTAALMLSIPYISTANPRKMVPQIFLPLTFGKQ